MEEAGRETYSGKSRERGRQIHRQKQAARQLGRQELAHLEVGLQRQSFSVQHACVRGQAEESRVSQRHTWKCPAMCDEVHGTHTYTTGRNRFQLYLFITLRTHQALPKAVLLLSRQRPQSPPANLAVPELLFSAVPSDVRPSSNFHSQKC